MLIYLLNSKFGLLERIYWVLFFRINHDPAVQENKILIECMKSYFYASHQVFFSESHSCSNFFLVELEHRMFDTQCLSQAKFDKLTGGSLLIRIDIPE